MKLKLCRTIGENIPFCYYETEDGIFIFYGKGGRNSPVKLTFERMAKLILNFSQKICPIKVGSDRQAPPQGSLGRWLLQHNNIKNVKRTAIASYVAAILVEEGFAVYAGKQSKAHYIKFK